MTKVLVCTECGYELEDADNHLGGTTHYCPICDKVTFFKLCANQILE